MSTKIHKTIVNTALGALCVGCVVLWACKIKPMDTISEPGEIKVSVKALKLDTKNVSLDGFNEKSQIGITSISEGVYTASNTINIYQRNIGYKFGTTTQYWKPISDTLRYKPLEPLLVFSYFPMANENAKTTKYFDNYILFDLITQQNSVDDLTDNDLMYAVCRSVSETNPFVSLEFSHKLTKLSFKMIRGLGWTQETLLTQIKIEGQNIITQTKLALVNGTLENTKPTTANNVTFTTPAYTPFRILDTNEKTVDMIVIPSGAKGSIITFTVNGVDLKYVLKQDTFEPSTNYIYNVTISPPTPGGEPIPIDATIQNWEVRADIVVEPK